MAGAQRGLSLCQSLLRAQLGQRVNVMILEKALTLELAHFEDSEFYDKLTRARREASSRPLSLVMRTFGLVQNAIFAGELRRPAVPLLAVGGRGAAAVGPAGVHRRSALLRRCLPAVPLALAGNAHAAVPGVGAGARGPCQGGAAVWPGRAAAGALSQHLHDAVSRRSRADHPARCVGLFPRPDRHRARCTWPMPGSRWRPFAASSAGQDDHVSGAVPPGAVRRFRGAVLHRRHVRGQPVPVDAVRIPGHPGARRRAGSCSRARIPRMASASRT